MALALYLPICSPMRSSVHLDLNGYANLKKAKRIKFIRINILFCDTRGNRKLNAIFWKRIYTFMTSTKKWPIRIMYCLKTIESANAWQISRDPTRFSYGRQKCMVPNPCLLRFSLLSQRSFSTKTSYMTQTELKVNFWLIPKIKSSSTFYFRNTYFLFQ